MEKLGNNPANRPGKTTEERKRIPMSVPVQKLEVPEIPGYHLHWFRGDAARIQRAMDGGYERVLDHEIMLNNVSLGGNSGVSGNTDMGSGVSVIAGKELDHTGQPIRMVLMKIKQEWYEEDQKLVEQRNDQVADSITGGVAGAAAAADKGEIKHRYIDKSRTQIPELFTKGAMARKYRR